MTVSEIKSFIKYDIVRFGGKYNMIVDWSEASTAAGLSVEEYRHVLDNYSEFYNEMNGPWYIILVNTEKDSYTRQMKEDNFRERCESVGLELDHSNTYKADIDQLRAFYETKRLPNYFVIRRSLGPDGEEIDREMFREYFNKTTN